MAQHTQWTTHSVIDSQGISTSPHQAIVLDPGDTGPDIVRKGMERESDQLGPGRRITVARGESGAPQAGVRGCGRRSARYRGGTAPQFTSSARAQMLKSMAAEIRQAAGKDAAKHGVAEQWEAALGLQPVESREREKWQHRR